jgi:hypothetical protein
MASFVKLDENNIVVDGLAVHNDVVNNLPFPESEPLGVDFLTNLFGPSNWKQTSYSASFRKHYAGIGYIYDAALDAFILPKPFSSWLLNTETCQWQAPTPYPTDGKQYYWDEETQQWVEVA